MPLTFWRLEEESCLSLRGINSEGNLVPSQIAEILWISGAASVPGVGNPQQGSFSSPAALLFIYWSNRTARERGGCSDLATKK